jgi:polysaccharide export outer membrane protein
MNKAFVLLIALVAFLSSCNTYKKIPYYQDLNRNSATEESIKNFKSLSIQTADVIGVNVSSRTPEASAVFNYSAKDMQSTVSGYLVNDKGEVSLPLIGDVKLAGLTLNEAQVKIAQLLGNYFKDPVVNVRLLNFKIAVYGDVLKPDVYSVKDQNINIMQALAMAGDLNITGMRKNVILVREVEGKRNYIPVDLTSKEIFQSPYYYLKNNDQIYVQPDQMKLTTVDYQ